LVDVGHQSDVGRALQTADKLVVVLVLGLVCKVRSLPHFVANKIGEVVIEAWQFDVRFDLVRQVLLQLKHF